MNWPVKLTAGELTVRFDRTGDRVGHAILIGDSEVPLLDSLEGESDQAWPPSPPFQELTLETRGDRQIALLVGKAGTSHWSASVDPFTERKQVSFDIACRVQQLPEWLGSRYTVPANADARLQNGSIIVDRGDQLLAIAGSIVFEKVIRCGLIAGGIAIAGPKTSGQPPDTIRWRYTVSRMFSPPIAANLSE